MTAINYVRHLAGGVVADSRSKPPPPMGAAVWPCRRPRVSHLGPVDQAARHPETGVAFAYWYLYGVETGVAFARAGSAPTETAIAFAGERWAFWVRFSVAEVMVVSMVAVWG